MSEHMDRVNAILRQNNLRGATAEHIREALLENNRGDVVRLIVGSSKGAERRRAESIADDLFDALLGRFFD